MAILVAIGTAGLPAATAGEVTCLFGATATAHIDGTIDLAWASIPGATAYQVVFREGDQGAWIPIAPQVPGASTVYTFSPTTAGVVYDFVIVALDGGSNPIAEFCQVSATGQGPACPENVTAVREKDGVHLSWDPVAGVDGYNIYRSVDLGDFLFQGHVTTTSALDNGNDDEGTDITNSRRDYMIKSTLGQGQSGGCLGAFVVEIPFLEGPLAWTMAAAAVAAAAVVIARRRP